MPIMPDAVPLASPSLVTDGRGTDGTGDRWHGGSEDGTRVKTTGFLVLVRAPREKRIEDAIEVRRFCSLLLHALFIVTPFAGSCLPKHHFSWECLQGLVVDSILTSLFGC